MIPAQFRGLNHWPLSLAWITGMITGLITGLITGPITGLGRAALPARWPMKRVGGKRKA
jgi:hypothetical protein